jgi:lysyl-tRNA synthetase class 2
MKAVMDDGTEARALPRRRLVRHALTPEVGSRAVGLAVAGVGVAGVRMGVTTAGGATLFAGTAFGLLGGGNVHRRPGARHITFTLLAGWAAVSVLIDPHLEVAVVAVGLALLVARATPKPALLPGPARRTPLYAAILLVVAVDVTYGIAALSISGRLPPGMVVYEALARLVGLSGSLAVHGRFGPPVAGSVTALGVASIAGLLLVALAPAREDAGEQEVERTQVQRLVNDYESDTVDAFALRRDKRYVLSSGQQAALAYRTLFGVALASGDPVGRRADFEACLLEFVDRCDRRGWRPVVMMARGDRLALYERLGFKLLYLGDEAVLDVAALSLTGGRMRNVRQAVSRSANFGVTTEVVRESALAADPRRSLMEIAKRSRGGQAELGFSMSLEEPFTVPYPDCIVVLCRDRDGRPIAFQRYVLCKGGTCLSLDAMRRHPDAPNGVNERMIVDMASWARGHGVAELSVNFVGFRRMIAGVPGLSVSRALAGWTIRRANPFSVASLYRFSAKFEPRWVPRYLAYRSTADLGAIGLAALRAEGFLPSAPRRRHHLPADLQAPATPSL